MGQNRKASLNEPLRTTRFLGRFLPLVGVLVLVAFLVPVKAFLTLVYPPIRPQWQAHR